MVLLRVVPILGVVTALAGPAVAGAPSPAGGISPVLTSTPFGASAGQPVTHTVTLSGAGAAAFPPADSLAAVKATLAELLHRLLPPRRRRANPRVIKRKVASWPLKRAQHYVPHHLPEPAVTIVPATKPNGVKRAKAPKLLVWRLTVAGPAASVP